MGIGPEANANRIMQPFMSRCRNAGQVANESLKNVAVF
jgi:hypothetical protein